MILLLGYIYIYEDDAFYDDVISGTTIDNYLSDIKIVFHPGPGSTVVSLTEYEGEIKVEDDHLAVKFPYNSDRDSGFGKVDVLITWNNNRVILIPVAKPFVSMQGDFYVDIKLLAPDNDPNQLEEWGIDKLMIRMQD